MHDIWGQRLTLLAKCGMAAGAVAVAAGYLSAAIGIFAVSLCSLLSLAACYRGRYD